MAEAGRYLFGGLSGMGQSIAGGLEMRAAMQERAAEEQKQRNQERTRLVKSLDAMGIMAEDEAGQRSLEELQGVREGVLGRIKLTEALQQQAAETELEAALQKAIEPSAREAMDIGPGAVPLNRGRLIEALSQHPGAARSPRFANVMNALREQESESPLVFGKDDIIDLERLTGDPRLAGQFVQRQSRGSFQNINTQPRPTGGLPFKERVELMDRADLQKRRQAITSALGKYMPAEQVALLTQELQAINDRLSATEGNPGNEAGKSPYPEGTRLRGKDGKLYVVRNGKPELE